MKFYKRFPGDITIKTGDLSLVEFGAYDRLLDHYYAKEHPIEPSRVYTVARCQCAADRHAVDFVLAEFWTLTEEGWVQSRADEMIAEAQPKIEAARANGLKGGRPRKTKGGTEKEPTGLFVGTKNEPNEKTSQSQKKEISKPAASHPLAGGFDDFWLTWPKNERKQDKAKCLDHWKRNSLATIAARVIADVRLKRGTQKWQEGYVEAPLVYLRGRRWEDGVEPEAPRSTNVQALTVPGESMEAFLQRKAAIDAADAEKTRLSQTPEAIAARNAAIARVKGNRIAA